jgi:serine O-acetyltransferase
MTGLRFFYFGPIFFDKKKDFAHSFATPADDKPGSGEPFWSYFCKKQQQPLACCFPSSKISAGFQYAVKPMLNEQFLSELLQKHQQSPYFPPTSQVAQLFTKLLLILFPEQTKEHFSTQADLQKAFDEISNEMRQMLSSMQAQLPAEATYLAQQFMAQVPEIYRKLMTDVQAILNGDPAARTEYEVIRAYPGFYAIAFYRMAHGLYSLKIPLLPRVLTEYAHSKTGIDIHPGAQIGEYFFIDHGTGIVIGETCIIGNRVKIYQGVTLGALSVSKEMASQKRHPTIEDDVVIYSGATILGADTIIGRGSVIGGNKFVTNSVYPGSKVYN